MQRFRQLRQSQSESNGDQAKKQSEEANKAEHLRALSMLSVLRIGFSIFSDRKLLQELNNQQRRNLMMVARVIQTLLVGVTFGARDHHFQGMNDWLAENRTHLNQFLQRSTVSTLAPSRPLSLALDRP